MIVDVIRHGKTANNLAGRFNVADEPLLADEVERLRANTIEIQQYDRIYVSPLRRCIETAEALGLLCFETDGRLGERRFGIFGGMTPSECREKHGGAFEVFSRFDADFAPPGGESRTEHFARIWDWLRDICGKSDKRVLAVTHGGTLDFLYRLATARPLHGGQTIFAGDNAAISSFRVEWPRIHLLSFSKPLVS